MPTSSEDDVAERSVLLPKPLHARPAGQLAKLAGQHKENTIELVAGEKKANARSVLAVMGMGAVTGTEMAVTVTGPDAPAVADAVVEILSSEEAANA
ncbi:MAG TPA: HPr family phosphocarrier protein [Asanoa sp.]|nr:HPr family phosphocarrier protein [Asanoa sp.]